MKIENIKQFRFIFVVILFCFTFFFTNSVFAEERINNFDAQIKINKDASILVNETIKYDFGDLEKHGIYRYIPVEYDTPLGNKSIKLEIQNVTRDGVNENYTTSYSGSNKSIKIGNADLTINGEHIYNITYKVIGAIGYFDNYDELYWNITGSDWPVNILNTTTSIELMGNGNEGITQTSCYLGTFGSKEKCDSIIEGNVVSVYSSRSLSSGEGLTIAVGFLKGIVYKPTQVENIFSTIKDNIILFLPFVVFFIMFFIWRKYGKDPKGLSTIVAEYEPPQNMKPTLVGSLVDGKVDPRDITAGLIYLAQQGFIKISKLEKKWLLSNTDYEIELLKSDTIGLEQTDKAILNLFLDNDLRVGKKKKISDFKSDKYFAIIVKEIKKDIYQDMTDKGFYETNPMKAKTPYILIFPIILFVGLRFFSVSLGVLGVVAIAISGTIVIVFGYMMGKKTRYGAETRDHILGFKEFLSITEKDRLDFHNAPEKKPEQFMKFLPYAIALGVEKKWAKQFEGIYIPQPSWYQGNMVGSFIALDFVSHMSGFSQSLVESAMSGGSGSGGGGFSGGGGGGGGGGSW
jgi:uncharacterized membrane protein